MAVLGVTTVFNAGTAIVASQMNTNFDDIEAFVNTTPGVLQLTGGTVTGAVQLNNTLTLGGTGAGHDVILWGDTTGDYFWYDADTNKLVLEGANGTTALDVTDGNVVIGDGTLTVGSDGAGEDVTFYSDTAGDSFVWDSSAEKLTITGTAAATALDIADGNVTIADDLDVDGTTNLDAVDIDGAVQIDGTVTVGVNDTGHDVKFFGATATNGYMLWDEDTDDLVFGSAVKVGIGSTTPVTALEIASDDDLTDFTSANRGMLTLTNTDHATDDIVALDFRYTTGAEEPSARIGARMTGGGSELVFGTSNDYAGITNEAITINTSGNVGIGTTSPSDKLHVADATTTVSGTQIWAEGKFGGYGAGVSFASATSDGGTLKEMAKITGDGDAAWNTTASTQDASLRFFTCLDGTLAEKVRVQSAGGISFNGDTAAANALDTYEEGTWSPTYYSSGGDMTSVVVNATFTKGTYVRIGKQVWINCFIRTDSIGALGSGWAHISGLPFDSENVAGYNSYPAACVTRFAFDSDGPTTVSIPNNANYFVLWKAGAAGAVDHQISATDLSTAANRNGIAFQMTYITDAAV